MMQKAFQNHIKNNLTFLLDSKLLIAISGGLDSVVLTHLCKQANLNFALAHCNFNLRGKESDTDETFVFNLAESLDVEIFVEHFDTDNYAKINKLSTQMAARELRYNWFYDLSEQLQFDYILTAHHADDNLETFLINLSRGTGIEGLIGIPQVNVNVIRPLLKFSREELEIFAKNNNLKWREDSSNASTKYLRNKLRHEVIPKLKENSPEFLKNFEKTQNNLKDTRAIVQDAVIRAQKKVVSVEDDVIRFHIKKLQNLSNTKAYLYAFLKDFKFTAWNDVYNLLDAQSGKYVYSETHRLIKDRKYLLLTKVLPEIEDENILISKEDRQVDTNLGVLFFDEADAIFGKRSNSIFVDKDLLKFPLTVRGWRKGDYFYPFGMQGKKKLSKFFKDEKYPLIEKEKALVLCSGDDVIWIINKRDDNRFRVTEKTNHILKITLQ